MSQQKETCQFCGGEIVFRVIRGRTTPLHIGDEKCEGRKLYRKEQEGIAHPTKCPRCGGAVFFLRNNGGSVWLESIGWPWPKHPCFENESANVSVLPKNINDLKNGMLRFLLFYGILKTGEGFVAAFTPSKKDARKGYLRQWAIICSRDEAEQIGPKLDGKCVVVSFDEKRMVTFDNVAFEIKEHTPRYYSKFKD
jgi:hypothetical protein